MAKVLDEKDKLGKARITIFVILVIFIIGASFLLSLSKHTYGDKEEVGNMYALGEKKFDKDIESVHKNFKYNSGIEGKIEKKGILGISTYMPNNVEKVKIKGEVDYENNLICYLTFDDGPSKNITPQILEVLKEQNVKVTFFVIGSLAEKNKDILLRAYNDGHYIANHTYSHNYEELYSSLDVFVDEVEKGVQVIKKITGSETKLFRFPGGSFGRNKYINLLESKGYEYVDWNSVNGDAEGHNISNAVMMKKISESMYGQSPLIVLMHDSATKQTTVDNLINIIDYIRGKGYEFRTMEGWSRK